MSDYDSKSYSSGQGRKPSYASNSRDNAGSDKANVLFGGSITLPSNITPLANFLKNNVKPYIVGKAEGAVNAHMPGMLEKVGVSEAAAGTAAQRTGAALAYLIIFSDELAGATRNVKNYIRGKKQLAEDLSPVMKAHGVDNMISGLFSGALKHNEVVDVARSRLRQKWVQDTYTDMSELAASLPALYVRYAENKQKRLEQPEVGQPKETHEQRYLRFKTEMKAQDPTLDQRELSELWKAKTQEEALLKQQSKQDIKDTQQMLDRFIVPGGAAAAEVLRGYCIGREQRASDKETALGMIKRFAETVIDDKKATGVGGVPFDAYVRKIFETHQENMDEPHIGKRFDEQMNYACKEIARAVTDGKMHPMALVALVGERKIVKEKGKHIASREEVTQAIDEQIKLMPAKFAVDAEEYIAEAPVTGQDIKQALDTMPEKDRAFYISLMPEEGAKKIGVSETDIAAAHEIAKEGFAEHLSQAALDLATLSDEKLKEAKLSEAEIKLIREIAPQAKEGQLDKVMEKVTTKGQFKEKLDTTVVYAMGAGLVQHPGALYDKAGQKLYAEHEHPDGEYLDSGDDGKGKKEKNKPVEKKSAGLGFGADETDDAELSERKSSSLPHASSGHGHGDWDSLEEAEDSPHKKSPFSKRHAPDSHVRHAHHDGMQQAHDRHLS